YKLKDGREYLKTIVSALFSQITDYDFIYENSLTKCGESVYKSAFCFTDVSRDILTRAEGSGKATTIQVTDNCIVTTLLLSDSQCSIKDFIAAIGLDNDKPDYPQWLIEYDRLDDEMQKKLIEGHTAQVEQLQNEINQAEKKLASNLRYKSVLTENGDRLVEVVFEILEKILEYDLSSFKDEKKEDFLIRLKDCTFIGEIKGITSNVKSENVSQVDVHYQTYLEKLEAEGQQENVKALLIINAQRNKPLNERAEVHEKQIELAQRNGSLIIPTEKLLCIYERFLKQEVSSEQIIRAFNTQIGLLNTDLM
ncbi:MAG: hypothetical protein K2M95_01880, partial [Clostridiales bacterium]|nr:hypothetical protein [Clostridiales bacterium]